MKYKQKYFTTDPYLVSVLKRTLEMSTDHKVETKCNFKTCLILSKHLKFYSMLSRYEI